MARIHLLAVLILIQLVQAIIIYGRCNLVVRLFDFSSFLLFETFAYSYGKESFCDLSNQLPQQENLAARCKSDLKLKKRQISSGDDATVSHPIERITE